MFDNTDFNFDLDGDGVLDSFASEVDLDGDGIADMLALDTDGDQISDTFIREMDTNGDGIIDSYQIGADTNGDGIIDSSVELYDTDGNGIIDQTVNYADLDGDGEVDIVETIFDFNEDGAADSAAIDQLADIDGDGVIDSVVHGVDYDYDGIIDSYEVFDYDDVMNGEELNFGSDDFGDDGSGRGMFIDELENFDPDNADPDDIIGDPDEAMDEWEFQGDTNRCALYSQKFIIDEMTGEDVDIEEIADIAEENGWFTEDDGTNLSDMNQILNHFGIENEMSFGNDLDDLQECLSNGGKAIVSIDADEIWYGENDDIFIPNDGPNHAVEVIGIDNSDPDNPMIILNDSGNPDGCGEMVPADVFMDAWEDGGCQMIDVFDV